MKEFEYHLSSRDCRAIKTAEIDLAEIAVFAGINTGGKNTLARIVSNACERNLVKARLRTQLQSWRIGL